MNTRLIAFVALFTAAPAWAAVPDLLCSEPALVAVSPKNLKAQKMSGHTTFKFKNAKLYLTSADREEYLYNEVREEEPWRFTSGHKTIFIDKDLSGGVVVHADSLDIRISRIKCQKF